MSTLTEYKCEFCGDFAASKYNLTKHQKTKKKCIEIQKAKGLNVKDPVAKCQQCNKDFSIRSIKTHTEMCKVKTVQTQSNTNNNNSNNNTTLNVGDNNSGDIEMNVTIQNINLDFSKFFTDDKMADIFKQYNNEHAMEQMKGLARFIIENVLLLEDAPGYYIRDEKRDIFVYETNDGLKYDDKGFLLRKKIKDGAGTHINELVDNIIEKYSSSQTKKSQSTIQDMKEFKKDINNLHVDKTLMSKIKRDYSIKDREERTERVNQIKDSKIKDVEKIKETEQIKKTEQDRINKIKQNKFNIDKHRKDYVLSKGENNEPLSYTDKPILEELGLKYTDFYLEEIEN